MEPLVCQIQYSSLAFLLSGFMELAGWASQQWKGLKPLGARLTLWVPSCFTKRACAELRDCNGFHFFLPELVYY
jgi:hypothetical protein